MAEQFHSTHPRTHHIYKCPPIDVHCVYNICTPKDLNLIEFLF